MTSSTRGGRGKIAVIQRLIPHYRIDFFSQLCERLPNVMIFHSTRVITDGLVQNDDFHFPNRRVMMIDYRYFCFQRLVWKMMRSDYDFIVLGLELRIVSNLMIWLASFFKKSKIIWWTHGYNVHNKHRNIMFYIDRIIKTLLMKYSHKILIYNKYNLDELIQWGIDPGKIIILNNTINELPHQQALDNVTAEEIAIVERKTRKSSHSLMLIGRLTPMKRIDLFLEASKKLTAVYPDLRVFIIGDGSDRSRLEVDAQAMGLADNVFFLGAIHDPVSLAPYMKLTDFFVLPGAVGLSFVHSMVSGVPFVTLQDSPHGPEVAYLRNNYNGYAAANMDDMVNWLIDCFEHPEKIVTMKNNCLTMIKNEINMDGMVSHFVSAFQDK
ncbi:MAG: glycosyltransferase [Deltaproteobacteria bacterium]|nr:glycosyltransferase [Deltaproteobacteria bacterium]